MKTTVVYVCINTDNNNNNINNSGTKKICFLYFPGGFVVHMFNVFTFLLKKSVLVTLRECHW